jgi:dynein heavy chain 1
MKHLKKMFAGISTVLLDDDLTQIQGMASREGEEVPFTEPIFLKDYPKINDWLARIETMMRLSLANLLVEAVSELQTFYGKGQLQANQFMQWMEKYPSQLVTLAIQVVWTSSVEASLESSAGARRTLGCHSSSSRSLG